MKLVNAPTPLPALYAVTATGPRPLPVPPGARGFDGLYEGLELGVYSAFRTFAHDRFLDLDHHLARTVASMRRLGWDYRLDEGRLRRAIDTVCRSYPAAEMRVRIDVLAGPVTANGSASRELVALVPFDPLPPAAYRDGVAVALVHGLHREDPLTKRADFVAARRRFETGAAVEEHLIVDDEGRILEGFSSNFYAVREGVLRTAGQGVLEGITRRMVLDLAGGLGITVGLVPVLERELPHCEEAAISSSARGVVPVVRVDGAPLGTGRPGLVVTRLVEAYAAHVAAAVRRATDTA